MVKKFSPEFKQQSVDCVQSNAYLSIADLANHLSVGKSTLDKWVTNSKKKKESYT